MLIIVLFLLLRPPLPHPYSYWKDTNIKQYNALDSTKYSSISNLTVWDGKIYGILNNKLCCYNAENDSWKSVIPLYDVNKMLSDAKIVWNNEINRYNYEV